MPALSPFDHAFADGPVFLRAVGLTRRLEDDPLARGGKAAAGGVALVSRAGQIGPDVRLSLGAGWSTATGAMPSRSVATPSAGHLRLEPTGSLTIGERCYFGDGVLISAMNHVQIGDGTLFAHGVQVFDNNTHPVDAEERERHFAKILGLSKNTDYRIAHAPVSIGRRCWLGMNAIVFRGVTIGDDTVVAGGSVVASDLPSGVIASGNPAVPVRNLKESVAA